MTHQNYQNYPNPYYRVSPSVPNSALVMGGLGAVVGAGNAVAKTNRQVKQEEITKQQAVETVINETLGTGLAVAAAAAVVGATRARGVVSLAGILAVSAGAKYLWDTATAKEPEPVKVEPAKPEPKKAAQKSKPKATTAKKTTKTASKTAETKK